MTKKRRGHSIPLLREPGQMAGRPLYVRLYRRVRDGVLRGAIPPGTPLPSARTLAREEGISRNTVEAAYNQLRAEGFVVRQVGSGTRVRDDLPERLLRPARSSRAADASPERSGSLPVPTPRLSARGRRMAESGGHVSLGEGMAFAPCLPGLDALPLDSWTRVATRRLRRASRLLASPPPAGLPSLREAIAAYLHMDRGVRCTSEQILIVNSTQQALDLVARVLLDPGDRVWMEDPGYVAARRAFEASGAETVPIAVDEAGMVIDQGTSRAPRARLAYVTPSHQYPLGITLSLTRRLALLEWSEDAGSWILEDDYDSELRYDGRPLASVQGIDESGRVLYVGTFNKILFPGVRVAYVVLPRNLIEPFTRAREIADGFTSPLLQGVLADFMDEGHFATHVRRVRELYRARRDRFLSVAAEYLPDEARIGPAGAGMHVAVHLPAHIDDVDLATRGRAVGLATPALSAHAVESDSRGLVVHYGYTPVADIEDGVRTIRKVLARRL